MMTGAGMGILQDFLVENTHFFAKIQKRWIIIAPEKTEITRGDCNIFLHLCTAEKIKKNLIFVQGGKVTIYRPFSFSSYTLFVLFFLFFIDFGG